MIDSSASASSRRLWLAVTGSALTLLARHALDRLLMDWLKPFVRALAWILALGIVAITIAYARVRRVSAWLPASVCIVAGTFTLLAPFDR